MIISYIVGIGCSLLLAVIISILWVRGIDYMKENHPDYKGDEFFGFDDNDYDEDYPR
jgi:hypothetical protein